MHQTLYQKIKEEKNNIESSIRKKEKNVNPDTVSELLRIRLSQADEDKLVVICAFYEYMKDRVNSEYSFIKKDPWKDYYQRYISYYFTPNKISLYINEILNSNELTDIILNVCNNDVIEDFYHKAKTQNDIALKKGDKTYEEKFKMIQQVCIEKGIIKKNVEDIPNEYEPALPYETSDQINKKVNELRAIQEEKRDVIFNAAANKIDVDAQTLIKKVGKEESLNVDKIELEQELFDKATSNMSKVKTIPNKAFQKMASRLSMFDKELIIVNVDGMNILKINTKETIFDKIANCSNEVSNQIKKFVNEKKETLDLLSKKVGVLGSILKKAYVDTMKKSKEKLHQASLLAEKASFQAILGASETIDKAKQNVNKIGEKLSQTYNNAVDSKNEFFSNQASIVAEKLRHTADKISPLEGTKSQAQSLTETPQIKETYTYVNGKKIIVRAGTHARTIQNEHQLDESSRIHVA